MTASSTIDLLDEHDEVLMSTSIDGPRQPPSLVAGPVERVVFTVGHARLADGGILQDLFLWDLNEEPPDAADDDRRGLRRRVARQPAAAGASEALMPDIVNPDRRRARRDRAPDADPLG